MDAGFPRCSHDIILTIALMCKDWRTLTWSGLPEEVFWTPFLKCLGGRELYCVLLYVLSGSPPLQKEWFYCFPELALKDGPAWCKAQRAFKEWQRRPSGLSSEADYRHRFVFLTPSELGGGRHWSQSSIAWGQLTKWVNGKSSSQVLQCKEEEEDGRRRQRNRRDFFLFK